MILHLNPSRVEGSPLYPALAAHRVPRDARSQRRWRRRTARGNRSGETADTANIGASTQLRMHAQMRWRASRRATGLIRGTEGYFTQQQPLLTNCNQQNRLSGATHVSSLSGRRPAGVFCRASMLAASPARQPERSALVSRRLRRGIDAEAHALVDHVFDRNSG